MIKRRVFLLIFNKILDSLYFLLKTTIWKATLQLRLTSTVSFFPATII